MNAVVPGKTNHLRADTKTRLPFRRRRYVAAMGLVGTGVVAGCLGDDEVDPDATDTDDVDADDTDDVLPADDDDADDADDQAETDDTDDAPEPIERHDVTAYWERGPPVPADVQYARYGGNTPAWYDNRHQYRMAGRSFRDFEVYGELIESIDYQPGILEVTFRDDIFWWSGKVVDATDFQVDKDLADWHSGGEDLDNTPNIVAREQLDDRTVRLALADTWREDWALQQTLIEGGANDVLASSEWTQPWLEQYEDTGADMDAVGDLREELSEVQVVDDEDLVHQLHIPWEFRIDGSIGNVGENYWQFDLVPEKNGVKRRWVEDINYTGWRITAVEESGIRGDERFLQGDMPWRGVSILDLEEDIPFPIRELGFVREFDQWGWTMNAEAHPTDNPYFRRAWNFACPRGDFEAPGRVPQDFSGHPYLTAARVRQWTSEAVFEALTDYGFDAEWDRAEADLERGGFERNGDGAWLRQDDGEPIDITIGTFNWMGYVADLGSDWYADFEDFGISTEVVTDTYADDPWTVEAQYIGGLLPEFLYSSVFGEEGLTWAAPNPNLPESVEAPPLGETDAPQDDWVVYDTRAMTDRLGVTVDDDAYQDMVDQLTWVANQVCPRTLMTSQTQIRIVNDERWHVPLVEEAPPEKYLWLMEDRMWHNGLLSYVPEEDR